MKDEGRSKFTLFFLKIICFYLELLLKGLTVPIIAQPPEFEKFITM
jgi:hypothetical protein